jgi:hypothetical protein
MIALETQIERPSGSTKRNQASDTATQITTPMKSRSNQFVSIGRNPGGGVAAGRHRPLSRGPPGRAHGVYLCWGNRLVLALTP